MTDNVDFPGTWDRGEDYQLRIKSWKHFEKVFLDRLEKSENVK